MEPRRVMDTMLVSRVRILYIRSLLARSPELQSIKVPVPSLSCANQMVAWAKCSTILKHFFLCNPIKTERKIKWKCFLCCQVSPVERFLEKPNNGRSRSSSRSSSPGRSPVRYDSSSRNMLVEDQIQGFKVNIKPEKKSKLSSVVLKIRGIDQVMCIPSAVNTILNIVSVISQFFL